MLSKPFVRVHTINYKVVCLRNDEIMTAFLQLNISLFYALLF